MLQHLKEMILKGHPMPPDDPPHQLQQAQQALEQAEEFLSHTRATTSEKLAERQVEQRKAELQQAEQEVRQHELRQLTAEMAELLNEKTVLLQRVRLKFCDVLPDLTRLDEVERRGTARSSAILAAQMDSHSALGSGWRDAVLPGCSDLVKRWLQRLEA